MLLVSGMTLVTFVPLLQSLGIASPCVRSPSPAHLSIICVVTIPLFSLLSENDAAFMVWPLAQVDDKHPLPVQKRHTTHCLNAVI